MTVTLRQVRENVRYFIYNSYIRHIHNESQRHIIVHTGLTTDFKSFHVQQVNHT